MGRVVILALDPRLEASIQRGERSGVLPRQAGEQLCADRFEPAFDFPFSLGPVRAGMNQGDTELGADQGQVLGAVIRPVIDVQPSR